MPRQANQEHLTDLPPRQARFVAEYLIDLNGKRAAIRAGYSPRSAEVTASKLLRNPKVRARVKKQATDALERVQLRAEDVLRAICRIALADPGRLYDPNGNMIPIWALTPEDAAMIAGFEVEETERGQVVKVRFHDKIEALRLAARYLGLLTKRVEVADTTALIKRLHEGRARVATAKRARDQARASVN